MSSTRRLMSFALLLAAVQGCSNGSPTTYEVRGVVRFPDGLPLTAGTIEFQSLAQETPFTATGEISTDGTYKLGTFDIEDRAVEGRHRIVIVASHEIGTGVERPGELAPAKLHPRFGDYRTSGLEFEVKRGKNEFQIPAYFRCHANVGLVRPISKRRRPEQSLLDQHGTRSFYATPAGVSAVTFVAGMRTNLSANSYATRVVFCN